MDVFEVVIALLLGGAALAALARRIGTPYPALVALAGAALALLPGTPTVVLDPELALALFVAPVLLDAAFDASARDLVTHWRTVAGLALGAVILTVVAVAVVVHWLVPGMPWAAAIALGAIVAPPDAAAATAVLKQLRPPHNLLVILEGESLFNDAGALLIYRLAVGAAVAGTTVGWNVVPTLLVVTVGSIGLGLLLQKLATRTLSRIEDVATAVIVQFCVTFAIWILAERLHLSGILTTVTFAMSVARDSGELTPARVRVPSFAVWEVAVFVLNVLAFVIVGLQLKPIVAGLDRAALLDYVGIAAAVCAATIGARLAWVAGVAALSRSVALSPRGAALVGWCGMRGIVTLAAAMALPVATASHAAFPHRDLILFTAFSVVLGTLVVQGMTVRPLLSFLALEDDGAVESEVKLARVETLRAGLAGLDTSAATEAADLLRRRHELQLRRALLALEGGAELAAPGSADREARIADRQLVRTAMTAQRHRLVMLRQDGTIGAAAFQVVEQELDWMELSIQQVLSRDES